MTALFWCAVISLAAWAWLLVLRGGFWRASQRLGDTVGWEGAWPGVIAVIPARNEAAGIAQTLESLAAQDYPGPLTVVVVDDNSDDDTAAVAAATSVPNLEVVRGKPLAPEWTGKVWAMAQGVARADTVAAGAKYLLFTDADIVHATTGLRQLVTKAENEGLVLTSLMVKLRCRSFWEHLLIPAFVFFFQKLYPFDWVNDLGRPLAAAAGGCMLVARDALRRTGGIEGIRNELIDDCALARQLKRAGPIWLGLATETHSLRAYERLGDIWRMVARTAFVQLRQSALLLLGTVAGMILLYALPIVAVVAGAVRVDAGLLVVGGAGWLLMAACYAPTLRLYGLSLLRAFSLPLAGILYSLFTVDSARRHWLGRGGAWKGRTHEA